MNQLREALLPLSSSEAGTLWEIVRLGMRYFRLFPWECYQLALKGMVVSGTSSVPWRVEATREGRRYCRRLARGVAAAVNRTSPARQTRRAVAQYLTLTWDELQAIAKQLGPPEVEFWIDEFTHTLPTQANESHGECPW